jgi:hypothetical protein
MRVVVHADAEAIYKFTAQPRRYAANGHGNDFDHEDTAGDVVFGVVHAQEPGKREEKKYDRVGAAVQQAEPLGPGGTGIPDQSARPVGAASSAPMPAEMFQKPT